MSEVKCFEVRDEGTLIPVMAICVETLSRLEGVILLRGGHRMGEKSLVFLINLNTGITLSNPQGWYPGRTLRVAHQHIIDEWGSLETGSVIDVEFILGETSKPKANSL